MYALKKFEIEIKKKKSFVNLLMLQKIYQIIKSN